MCSHPCFFFFRYYRSTDTVDHRRERSGKWLDVDHGKAKRIGDTAATSSRHRADFRPWRVRRLALRKRICRQRAAADQLTQEASIGTQLRASFTTAMRLERRRRRSCTHARMRHDRLDAGRRTMMPFSRRDAPCRLNVERRRSEISKKSYLSLGSRPLPFTNPFTTNTSFNEITAQNFTSRLLYVIFITYILYIFIFIFLILYTWRSVSMTVVNLYFYLSQFKFSRAAVVYKIKFYVVCITTIQLFFKLVGMMEYHIWLIAVPSRGSLWATIDGRLYWELLLLLLLPERKWHVWVGGK